MNLTAIEEPTEVAYKHFVDSAYLLRVVPDLQQKSMIDIGTGAGFPGAVSYTHLIMDKWYMYDKRSRVFLPVICITIATVCFLVGLQFKLVPVIFLASFCLTTANTRCV